MIAIGTLSENIYCGVTENGGKALWFKTKQEFLEKAPQILSQGDVILIKASHFMNFGEIVNKLKG